MSIQSGGSAARGPDRGSQGIPEQLVMTYKDRTYHVNPEHVDHLNFDEPLLYAMIEGVRVDIAPQPLEGRVAGPQAYKRKQSLDMQEQKILARVEVLSKRLSDPAQLKKVGPDFLGFIREVAEYRESVAAQKAKATATSWRVTRAVDSMWSAAKAVVVTSNASVIDRAEGALKEEFAAAGWTGVQALYMQAAMNPNLSKEAHSKLKKEIQLLIKAMDDAGVVEMDPKAAILLPDIELEFGLLGSTAQSRDRILAAGDLSPKIAAANGLVHYIFSHSRVVASLDRGFLRQSGSKHMIDEALAAYREGGTNALQECVERLDLSKKELIGVLKAVFKQDFESIMFVDESNFQELVTIILGVVRGEHRHEVKLKSVYQGFPLAKPMFKELEWELAAFNEAMKDSGNEEYALLLPVTEVDLVNIVFFPAQGEIVVHEDLQVAIRALIDESFPKIASVQAAVDATISAREDD